MMALFVALAGLLAYSIALAIHRLALSPLAGFPGPKFAGVTGWYEFYFDWWLQGKYLYEIERLHTVYGPIVRINPHELSVRDPEFYSEIYVTEYRRRTDHYDAFCGGLNFDDSFLLTGGHDLHRHRRKPFEPFFSKKGVIALQSTLASVALKLESRLKEAEGKGIVIRLEHAFACYAGDIMRSICLGEEASSDEFLNDPDFSPDWYNIVHDMVRQTPLFTGFPWLVRMVNFVPKRFLTWAFPQGHAFDVFARKARLQIRNVMNEASNKRFTSSSVFHQIVNSDMPASEKTEDRLTKEAQVILTAGTITTSRVLAVAWYHVASNPDLRCRLEVEVENVMADWPQRTPAWAELEKLLLLQGIVKESLRIAYGVMHRLPRISPDEPVQYKQWIIPAGVPVGMSAYMMHTDERVYPSPERFIPERWIGDIDPAMNRNWVPFARGSRHCIGSNLAMAEMSLILAVLFRKAGSRLEVFETDESDVTLVHDFLIPLPRLSSKGVRAIGR